MKLSEKFLSESDKIKIQNAVKEVERSTSGEIVPMIVSSSYSYPLSNFIGGFILAMIIALLAVLISGYENLWLFLAVFMPCLLIMQEIIKHIHPLKKLYISEKEIDAEVQEAAITEFYKQGLYRTRDETGVLIFISVFEKKVWVIADRGINSKVNPDTWQKIVDHIITGIRDSKQGEAICEAVAMTGEILRSNFPAKRDDTDELHNLIIK